MASIEFPREYALPCNHKKKLTGIAFDGCSFYLPAGCAQKVYRYDCCFTTAECIDTSRCYSCICYDEAACCFWAASRECPNRVFQLNLCLQEIDSTLVACQESPCSVVTGLSSDRCNNRLLVAFPGSLYSFCPKSGTLESLYRCDEGWICGVLSAHPGYILTRITQGEQSVLVFNEHGCEVEKKDVLPECFVEQILLCSCRNKLLFYALVTKQGCYSKVLMQCVPPGALGYEVDLCCVQACCDSSPGSCCHTQGCTDIAQSIALVEAALSHILNAEGEKLQKVLATTDDMKTILDVNRNINQTIVNVTHLEQLLYNKLVAANECREYSGCRGCCHEQEAFCADPLDFAAPVADPLYAVREDPVD